MTADGDRIRGAFRSQGKSCAMLGSPFMGRLMALLAERLNRESAVGARVLDWAGDVGPGGHSVPLRLAGALHGLVLDGADPDLAAVYPPNAAGDAALWTAVEGALGRHHDRLNAWLDNPPQTNEVRRAAVLLPAIWWLLARTGQRPVVLSELGASAGLNLMLDRFALKTPVGVAGPADSAVRLAPDWRGPPPPALPVDVTDRRGVDRNPLDPRDPDDALRLLAYLWPDQPERMARTRAALSLDPPRPDKGDAAPWLVERLAARRPGRLHVVYTTIAWQYFPPETQATCASALEDAGTLADAESPLAHVALEADGQREGAALSVRLWPHAPAPKQLARADFHGRWIDWLG